MARFNPDSHPDRFVFEARARQIRAEEIAKVWHALAQWISVKEHALAGRLAHLGHGLMHRLHIGAH